LKNVLISPEALEWLWAGHKLESRDIVDGHRQKTLQLLWTLIFVFKVIIISVSVMLLVSAL